jgi:ribosomal RNA-processing protein 12
MYPKFSRPKRIHRPDKSLPEDLFDQLEDEPLDLLDQHKTRSALRSSAHLKRKQESDDEPEIDPEGRLIVCGGKQRRKRKQESDDEPEINLMHFR